MKVPDRHAYAATLAGCQKHEQGTRVTRSERKLNVKSARRLRTLFRGMRGNANNCIITCAYTRSVKRFLLRKRQDK